MKLTTRGRPRRRHALVAVAAVALLAACSSAGSGGGADDSAGGGGVAVDGQAESAADTDVTGEEGRQVITTAWATVVVDDPADAAAQVAALTESAGGRVDRRSEHTPDDERSRPSASLTVRVPADELTDVLASLEDVGEVREVSQDSTDVTQSARDLDARIAALETSTDRLIQIMAEADDSSDLLAAESALSERQAELEALQSERAYLADQVAMSTLDISLVAEADAPVVEAGGFLGGLERGWHALISFASGLLVVVGVLLPWLLVLGVPLLAIGWFVRRRARRAASGGEGSGGPGEPAVAADAAE